MRRLRSLFVFAFIVCACLGSASMAAQNPHVVFETNYGDMVIELYPDAAPVTVDNFLGYVNSGYYDGILFHRSETVGRWTTDGVEVFVGELNVLQAGLVYMFQDGFYGRQAGSPIVNESDNGLSNLRGTLAMARSSHPDSATAQFFINHQDNTGLDKANYWDGYGYCVFGAIVEGLDVMDAIANADIGIFRNLTNFFPYNPYVIVTTAYVLPDTPSYWSDLASDGRIGLDDFALFASRWLDSSCGSANGFCDGTDMDYSGGVNAVDLDLFWNHWTHVAGYETRFSDLAYDKAVDIYDFDWFISHWLDAACDLNNNFCDQADINRDGVVDFSDYSLISVNWLKLIP